MSSTALTNMTNMNMTKLCPFPQDNIFGQTGILLYVANIHGSNSFSKLDKFCKRKALNNIDNKKNTGKLFEFIEGPKNYGWFSEIDGIPTISIRRRYYRDFLGCTAISHRLLAFKSVNPNKMAVALVQHHKFSKYALSCDVKTFLKEFSESSDVTIEYYNGNIQTSIPKAPNPVIVHNVILQKDGKMIECDKKITEENNKHIDEEIDSDVEKVCQELDNITMKRIVCVNENESINDFMTRIFEAMDKSLDFHNHINELHRVYPNVCMMCGSLYHNCCGYDNQCGESFKEGLYNVFRCSTIVNSRCNKCNWTYNAKFNKQTNTWDKKCKCK